MNITKKIIFIFIAIIVIAVGIYIFPESINTCSESTLCFGTVITEVNAYTWLNVKDSVLESREVEIKSCKGGEYRYFSIYDGCPGSWGWEDARPAQCEYELNNCDRPSDMHSGILCSEWERACEEIKNHAQVPIDILDVNATGVFITS